MNKRTEELAKERSYVGGKREKIIERVERENMTWVNLGDHITLFKLIREYDNISEDIDNCKNAETKSLLSRRLEEIKKRVQYDFLVYDMAK